jgi:hypothetical protein
MPEIFSLLYLLLNFYLLSTWLVSPQVVSERTELAD